MPDSFALQLSVFFRNAARRDTVMQAVRTRLGDDPQYGIPEFFSVTHRVTGDAGFICESRFKTQPPRDALWADLNTYLGTGVNGPITGISVATGHTCSHDTENPTPCVPDLVRNF